VHGEFDDEDGFDEQDEVTAAFKGTAPVSTSLHSSQAGECSLMAGWSNTDAYADYYHVLCSIILMQHITARSPRTGTASASATATAVSSSSPSSKSMGPSMATMGAGIAIGPGLRIQGAARAAGAVSSH